MLLPRLFHSTYVYMYDVNNPAPGLNTAPVFRAADIIEMTEENIARSPFWKDQVESPQPSNEAPGQCFLSNFCHCH